MLHHMVPLILVGAFSHALCQSSDVKMGLRAGTTLECYI